MKKKILSYVSSLFLVFSINLNAFDYNIVDGEQLLGAVYNIEDFTPFDNKCVNYLYYIDFPNGGQYYVRNINMTVTGYPTLTELKQGQGFILNATGNCTVTINEPSETIIFKGLTYKTIKSPTTSRIWLDRNLGALKICDKKRNDFSTNDAYKESQQDCFGDYYQWGRPADGHQLVTSLTTSTLQSNISNTNSKFSYNNNTPYDWTTSDIYGTSRSNNWSSLSGTGSAICPLGFRVPTVSEWNAEAVNKSVIDNIFNIPYAGRRISSTGNLISVGDHTKLWSVSPFDNYFSKNFTYSDSYAGTNSNGTERANGMTIRCIKSN
ncbi:fibrobacter succinogenes major paralogous domain-containing protein [Aliarcobacter butzleri]|uniref:FISUMP domain-containing protein n=1 Tax=Aliarcobacter butzleri TaxID=28197 RepID=UPI001919394F|nr:FISUMP domain-containing protein [Aliarcobacter butzleri]